MELNTNTLLWFIDLQKESPRIARQLVEILSGLKAGLRSGLQTDIIADVKLEAGQPDTVELQIVHELNPESRSLDERRITRFLEKEGMWRNGMECVRFYCSLPGYRLRLNRDQDRLEYAPKTERGQAAFDPSQYITTVVKHWKNWMKKSYSVDLDARGKIE
jgi:hypothetical protein